MRKRIWLCMLLFAAALPSEAAKDVLLTLPIRVLQDENEAIQLSKEDIDLYINGQRTEIVELKKRRKSLGDTPDLGRNFILSFHLTEYDRHVENGISYFITEILNTQDSLHILSPLKFYRIPVSPNKGKMVQTIEDILRKDGGQFRTEKDKALNVIERILSGMKFSLSTDTTGVHKYKQIVRFLSSFPEEYQSFKIHYQAPNTSRYAHIIDTILGRSGQRWWIHFQQKEKVTILSDLKEIKKRIYDFAVIEEASSQYHARELKDGLARLENQMLISDVFPSSSLQNTMLENDITYSTIFFRSSKLRDSEDTYSVPSQLESILSEISQATGGSAHDAPDSGLGMKELETHVDVFYDIVYPWNGRTEKMKIEIDLIGKELDLSFSPSLSQKRVASLVDFHAQEKIRIDEISTNENVVHFSVKSFKKEEQFGLIKIRVELFDGQDISVYREENTLRASKDAVDISLPIPSENPGDYRLVVTAFDLIANHRASADHAFTQN